MDIQKVPTPVVPEQDPYKKLRNLYMEAIKIKLNQIAHPDYERGEFELTTGEIDIIMGELIDQKMRSAEKLQIIRIGENKAFEIYRGSLGDQQHVLTDIPKDELDKLYDARETFMGLDISQEQTQ